VLRLQTIQGTKFSTRTVGGRRENFCAGPACVSKDFQSADDDAHNFLKFLNTHL